MNPSHAIAHLVLIRVRKEDSAYIYSILEANEGIASYSTLDHMVGSPYRDLELQVPTSQVPAVEHVLKTLAVEGVEIVRLN